jgi:UDP-N-acetylmuramate dehydrogenase
MNYQEIFKDLSVKVKYNEPLMRYTTLQVGGPAEVYFETFNLFELQNVLKICKANKIPVFVIGAGSNLLINDKCVIGAVIRLRDEFEHIEFLDTLSQCRAGAGVRLPYLIKKYVDNDYSGMELLSGIPGTVGGALVMNAGTKESTVSDTLISVKVMNFDGEITTLKKDNIKFAYRKSSLEGKIVLEASFNVTRRQKQDILEVVNATLVKRSSTQPLGTLNAGSVFKNPGGTFHDGSQVHPAGKLIEECGLKGHCVGKAKVSEKHANFIVNTGGATAEDVRKLVFEVREKVEQKFGIKLELELKII